MLLRISIGDVKYIAIDNIAPIKENHLTKVINIVLKTKNKDNAVINIKKLFNLLSLLKCRIRWNIK